MKRGFLILAVLLPGAAFAQVAPGAKPTPRPDTEHAIAAFALRPPDEGSPFFATREAAKAAVSRQGQDNQEGPGLVAVYPRTKNSQDSAVAMFGNFFTDMFSSVKLSVIHNEKSSQKLTIEPDDFSADRRELDASYTIRNNTNKLVRLDFPTSQRIEIMTRDSSGNVIDKWSDDRATKPQEGIVIINPKERIQYDETVPTRDMKAGQSYTIQAEVVGYPDYSATKVVTPTP